MFAEEEVGSVRGPGREIPRIRASFAHRHRRRSPRPTASESGHRRGVAADERGWGRRVVTTPTPESPPCRRAIDMAATKRRGVADAESQRLNIRISPDAYRRLAVHALMGGTTPGRLVEDLINAHCREWRVQANRSVPVMGEDRLVADDAVSLGSVAAA